MSRAVATVPIAAGVTTNTIVKATSGGLGSVLIQAVNGASAILVYDNPTGVLDGTVIGFIPATAAAGVYLFDMPARQGITVGGASTNPAMTVSYY